LTFYQRYSQVTGGFIAAAADFIGEKIGVKTSKIDFGIYGKRRWLTIPEYLELEIEGIKGSDINEDILVTNHAFTVSPGFDLVIDQSKNHHYRDHGIEWDSFGKKWLLFKVQARVIISLNFIFQLRIHSPVHSVPNVV